MHARLALLRLDVRRGGGQWGVPVGLVLVWFVLRNALTPGVALWPEISDAVGRLYVALTPLAVLLGAFAGGRERRRGTAELIASIPVPAWWRSSSLVASIFLWAFAVWAAAALPLVLYGVLYATWSGPDAGMMLVGLPVMAFGAAWGVAIGRTLGGGMTPVVALATFLPLFVVLPDSSVEARPLSLFALNAWFEPVVERVDPRPFSIWAQLGWGVGVTGVLAGIAVSRERRTLVSSGLLLGSLAIAVAGAMGIVQAGYEPDTISSGGPTTSIPASAICDDAHPVRVCVHPAYERLLPEVTCEIVALVGPMAGLEGVVDEVYVTGGQGGGSWIDDYAIHWVDLSWEHDRRAMFARDLRPWTFWPLEGDGALFDQAQYTVMSGLAWNAGVEEWTEYWPIQSLPMRDAIASGDEEAQRRVAAEEEAAIGRFAALSPKEQRAWLVANWDALTAGELTLEDLP